MFEKTEQAACATGPIQHVLAMLQSMPIADDPVRFACALAPFVQGGSRKKVGHMISQTSYPARRFCQSALDVSDQDVTTVGAALGSCEPRLLLAALLDEELGWCTGDDVLDSSCVRALMRKVASVLTVMRKVCVQNREQGQMGASSARGTQSPEGIARAVDALCPEGIASAVGTQPPKGAAHPRGAAGSSPRGSAAYRGFPCIIVPLERYEALDGRGRVRRRMGAALVPLDDDLAGALERVREDAARAALSSQGDLSAVARAESGSFGAWQWAALRRSLKDLAFSSWTEALGLRLWLPASLSAYERYSVLARVFWHLTYLGIDGSSLRVCWGERLSLRSRKGHDADGWDERADVRAPQGDESPEEDFFCAQPAFYDERFRADDELAAKMTRLIKSLNYRSWVDLLEASSVLAQLDAIA